MLYYCHSFKYTSDENVHCSTQTCLKHILISQIFDRSKCVKRFRIFRWYFLFCDKYIVFLHIVHFDVLLSFTEFSLFKPHLSVQITGMCEYTVRSCGNQFDLMI